MKLLKYIVSGKEKNTVDYNKINIKPFLKNDEIFYQFSYVVCPAWIITRWCKSTIGFAMGTIS